MRTSFTWWFTWCGHTSRNLCSQRVNQTSVHEKKPIRVFLNRCRWFLKQLTESTSHPMPVGLDCSIYWLVFRWKSCVSLPRYFGFNQLQCMSSEMLYCLEHFNDVGSIPSFFQTPKSQMFQSFMIWQFREPRNHPCKSMHVCMMMRLPAFTPACDNGTDRRTERRRASAQQ